MVAVAQSLLSNPRFVRQFVKFAIVGSIGAMVDFGVLIFLKEVVGFNLYVANTFSFSAAVLNNYVLNSFWTFADQEKRHQKQLMQFVIVSVIGLGINQVLLYFFHDVIGLWYIIAKGLAILLVLFWNFFANRFWTFRE